MKKQTEFKLDKRDSVWFQDNTAAVNCAYAKEVCDIAILPIGAIEQHGPHCPCGSDSFNAMGIAEAVARKSGAMILACPYWWHCAYGKDWGTGLLSFWQPFRELIKGTIALHGWTGPGP